MFLWHKAEVYLKAQHKTPYRDELISSRAYLDTQPSQ